MHIEQPGPALSSMTTLRVGGPARRYVVADTADEAIEVIADVDARGEKLLMIGGGSNLVVSDAGFDGTVLRLNDTSFENDSTVCAGAFVTVGAGHHWDEFVAKCADSGFIGVECLSGIPGTVGATPIQNVGAYGQDVSQTIARVRTYDRQERKVVTHFAADCGFAYRTSKFKQQPHRWVVLSVSFQLALGTKSAPVTYPELAHKLSIDVGQTALLRDVRSAVLDIRRSKAMVLDLSDHNTWSAGSFFTNPVVSVDIADALPKEAPRYAAEGGVKLSAAWLVENSGFAKGFGLNDRATLSTLHALSLTNRGSASASDILELKDAVQKGVRDKFGIELVPEPVIV